MPGASRVCATPSCPIVLTDGTRRCPAHDRRSPDRRPSPTARGYDAKWRRNSARFLKANPVCAIDGCDRPSEHSDHHPLSRRELLDLGVEHPDAWERLRPLCESHHNSKSARERR